MDRYSAAHALRNGPGDGRPTALQVVRDEKKSLPLNGDPLVIIITGATSGIGFETARALYFAGVKLFITARDIEKGKDAVERIVQSTPSEKGIQRHDMEVVALNLDSLASVRSAAAEILDKTDHINVLINNAGIAAVPFEHTEDGLERHWGVNFVAPFLLTYLLLPRLKASSTTDRRARIVNVSSTGHRLFPTHLEDPNFKVTAYDAMSAYATSKLANIYHANFIDRNFSAQGVHAVSIHPGTIPETQMLRALSNPVTVGLETSAPAGYKEEIKSPEQGAATSVFAAISSCLEDKGGLYVENCMIGKQAAPNLGPMDCGYAAFAFDSQREQDLWKNTCMLLDLPDLF